MKIGDRVTGKMFDLDKGMIIGEVVGMSSEDFNRWYKGKYDILPSETIGRDEFTGKLFLVINRQRDSWKLELCYENELIKVE